MKALKIILITLVVLGAIIYFAIWYGFRTTSENIAHLKPFSEIIGKELVTKQLCYIALNSEHAIKENDHIFTMRRNNLSGNETQVQDLPIGSVLKIQEAKRFTNGVTGFKSTYVLGTVFLDNLQKEVEFEFAWGIKNYYTDLPGDYFMYRLAPWQDKVISLMYNYDENLIVPLENYNANYKNTSENE